jgi:putative SOS response-associated peptidase YedK
MCTQFYLDRSPELKPYVDRAKHSPLLNSMIAKLGRPLKTEGVIRPTDIVPVVAPSKQSRDPSVFPMVWGFTNPRSGSPFVNARSETAAEKPFWKDSWQTRRCVIPASYYFEWAHYMGTDGRRKTGQKYMIQPKNSMTAYLAGLYSIEEQCGVSVPVFTVLTREPGAEIRFIHDRMPVILAPETIRQWIAPDGQPYEVIKTALTEMVFEPVERAKGIDYEP